MTGQGEQKRQASAASPLGAALEALARLKPEPAIDIGGLEPGWRTAAEIWADEKAMEGLLAAQAAFTADLDRKAQAAYLVIEQSMMTSMAVVVPLLVHDVVPEIAPDRIAMRFHTRPVVHRGTNVEEVVSAMRLLAPSFATHEARWAGHPDALPLRDHAALLDRTRRQIESFFRPLIRKLHTLTALPAGAMWRLVGDSVSAVFLDVGRRLGCEERAKRDALAILKHPGSELTNRQLHYFDIVVREPDNPARVLASRSFRSRGGCCRYYTSREGTLCTTCVLLDPAERDRNLESVLRARLGLAAPSPAHPV